MPKKVRADFFRVELPQGAPIFTELLGGVLRDHPEPAARNRQLWGYLYRLQVLERIRALWGGSFIRIRMDDLPHVAEIGGDTRALELDEDEGLGEETSFIYDPRYGVMVLQRNFQAVRPGTVQDYLAQLMDVGLLLYPVIRGDAVERLQGMRLVKRIDIGIATPTNPSVYRGVRTVKGVLETAQYVGAAQISVSMGMGHRKGSLVVGRVKDAAMRLLGVRGGGEEVRKVVVRGSGGLADEPLETIDLLEHRLVEEFTLETVDRQLPRQAVRQELIRALERQAEELRRQFGGGGRR